jgi:hypothetical protein
VTIEDSPQDASIRADGVLRTRIQRQVPAVAILGIFVDIDEDDVSFTADKIALRLEPVPT